MECDEHGNIVKLRIGSRAMGCEGFQSSESTDHDAGYGIIDNYEFDLHGCINDLKHVKKLTLEECRSIPEEITQMPSLEELEFVDSHLNEEWSQEELELHVFPTIRLPKLKCLAVTTSYFHETETIDPKLLSWISSSYFPSLELFLVITNNHYGPMVVVNTSNALCDNQSGHQIRTLRISDKKNPENDNHLYFPDIFLDGPSTPIHPNLEQLSLSTPCSQNLKSLCEIGKRPENRQYHPSLESSLCLSLEEFQFQPGRLQDETETPNDIGIMIQIQTIFKKLWGISKLLCSFDHVNPQSHHLEHLVKSNVLTAKKMTPQNAPVSLWPHVLEWAQRDFSHWSDPDLKACAGSRNPRPVDSTSIYQLLRPSKIHLGPALECVLGICNARKEVSQPTVHSRSHKPTK